MRTDEELLEALKLLSKAQLYAFDVLIALLKNDVITPETDQQVIDEVLDALEKCYEKRCTACEGK